MEVEKMFKKGDPISIAAAHKGGKAAQAKGTAHRWTPEEAKLAGKLGGKNKARKEKKSNK